MTNRAAVAWLAGLVLAAALIAGLVPVHADGASCGTALSGGPANYAVDQYKADIEGIYSGRGAGGTDIATDCADRRSSQRMVVIPVLAIAALAGGFLVLTARRKQEDQTPRAV